MFTLVFFGDFVCQDPSKVSSTSSFMDWAKGDVVACNFEAPVKSDGQPSVKSGPSLQQSDLAPILLKKMGFNFVQLANNHIMDYGEAGLLTTMKSLEGFYMNGAGYYPALYEPLIIEHDGMKIGLMSMVQHEFGTVDDNTDGTIGSVWINHSIISRKIRQAKEECDVLIMLPHAGFENIDAPLPEWRDRYKELIDEGADIVIASHPHVPQGWEEYKGKRIYYSLGNFCFDKIIGNNPYWTKSLSVKVEISDDLKLSVSHGNITFNEGVLDIDNSDETEKHNQYLQELLCNEALYEKYMDSQLMQFWETYKLYLLRGLGAATFRSSSNTFIHSAYGVLKGPDIPMLLNNFQCETHSWAIQRILRNLMKKK